MKSHAQLARDFLADENRADWHNETIYTFRQKRDTTVASIPEWEAMRQAASDIKDHVLANLDQYLEQFEANATANGVQVHWAADALEHNRIVHQILQENRISRVVKSKSMLTEECKLNEYLEARDIEVVDTDLGERIIQLKKEMPSHLIAPAVHLKREEVSKLFHQHLHTEKGNADPTYLTRAARAHLREKFLEAEAGITGVNFGVAESGGVVIVTNEGNADLGVNLAKVQIHCMGIEKIIPRLEDLGIFLRLITPGAAGQRTAIYNAHYHKPRTGTSMHIILVDNGRTEQLGRAHFRNSLKCIRCAACLNTCPVYRRSGGHSYHATIPGPIGAILMPGKDLEAYGDLPFASTLCGACSDVCPVKIDIHQQLYRWRQIILEKQHRLSPKKLLLKSSLPFFRRASSLETAGKFMRQLLRLIPRQSFLHQKSIWGLHRNLPDAPKQSFAAWYQQNKAHDKQR